MFPSKKEALLRFEFFADIADYQELSVKQTEIALAVLSQIDTAEMSRQNELLDKIKNLKSVCGRSYYVGPEDKLGRGCISCLTGNGLTAIRKTNKCNLNCPFCYNYGEMDCQPPIAEGLFEIGGGMYYVNDIPDLINISGKPSGVSYVYLEPFVEIEKYYQIIKKFSEAGVHQHMYTNGTLATKENLKALADSGLNELRFNLGASNCADRVIENIKLASKYIPSVGIETPMTTSFIKGFKEKKSAILNSGISFMNMAELHLNPNNIANYAGENMYMSRLGYVSPIWSRELTLKLMKEADDESWDIALHDCSNRTKFMRNIHLKKTEGGWFGATDYKSEFDIIPFKYFLPVLKDDSFKFIKEEEMPVGYRLGDIDL